MRWTRGDIAFFRRLPVADRPCAVPDFAFAEELALLPLTLFVAALVLLAGFDAVLLLDGFDFEDCFEDFVSPDCPGLA
jgi:hypothetical protein